MPRGRHQSDGAHRDGGAYADGGGRAPGGPAGGHRRGRRRHWLAAALALLLLAAAGYAVVSGSELRETLRRRGCHGSLTTRIAVTAQLADAVQEAADGFNAGLERVSERCVTADVVVLSRGEVDTVATAPGQSGFAAVVAGPGETERIQKLGESAGAALGQPVPVARTMAVIAMPRPLAEGLNWSGKPRDWAALNRLLLDPAARNGMGYPEGGTFRVWLSDPATSPESLAGLVGIAAGATGKVPSALRPAELADMQVQGALLSLGRQVTTQAESESALLGGLLAADGSGDLLGTVSAAFVDEQAVWSFNRTGPHVPLVALSPQGGGIGLDSSFSPLVDSTAHPLEAAAATLFELYLTGPTGQRAMVAHGFRSAGSAAAALTLDATDGAAAGATGGGATGAGTAQGAGAAEGSASGPSPATGPGSDAGAGTGADTGAGSGLGSDAGAGAGAGSGSGTEADPPSGEVRSGMQAAWSRMRNPGRFLVVVDVSGSMRQEVTGTGRTKLQFAQQAAIAGMRLVPPQAEIGLWEFSTDLTPGSDSRELVPLRAVGPAGDGSSHLDGLVAAVQGLTPRGDTALYDTALGAFRRVAASYQPGEPNVVVLLTDGRNDDPGSIDLDGLVGRLHAEQDPRRPVRILTIAYGADADAGALAAIAAATGGSAYRSPNPADIGTVFFRALSAG